MKNLKRIVGRLLLGILLTAASGCDDVLYEYGDYYSDGYETDVYYESWIEGPLADISLAGW
ncbi:MAG: hypothetical protein KDA33_07345 [Phycisphaerales bacterium]|nr:hypothetical protein [Phycisphaerales bacterium]